MHIYFDLDSTLCGIEGCDRLATQKSAQIAQHVATLTRSTMEGERSFDDVFVEKTNLIHPSRDDLAALGKKYTETLTANLDTYIGELLKSGVTVGIISQGYFDAICPVTDSLGIAREHVYGLHFDHAADGTYLGFPVQDLKYEHGKATTLRNIHTSFPDEFIIFVGDSYGDLQAGQYADLFIGCGWHLIREKVHQQADYFATDIKSLHAIIASHASSGFGEIISYN